MPSALVCSGVNGRARLHLSKPEGFCSLTIEPFLSMLPAGCAVFTVESLHYNVLQGVEMQVTYWQCNESQC